jgi:hypothetical protein
MTRHHCHQHDLASTSCRGQVLSVALSLAWLSGTIANMSRHLHHAAAKSPRQHNRQHDSTTQSAAWLDIYITLWSNRLGRFIASMTQQHYCQHDSAATLCNSLIINVNDIWLQQQADTLPAHTGTIHHYIWFLGQCKRPVVLLGIYVKHLLFEDSHLKTLSSILQS